MKDKTTKELKKLESYISEDLHFARQRNERIDPDVDRWLGQIRQELKQRRN